MKMLLKILFLVVLCLIEVHLVPLKDENTVGCLKCHPVEDEKINVHLIPHSHDDVGWLKTEDQYYYGMNTTIQQAGVQYIITSVVEALLQNPNRRFIQVETAYFWKWWQEQNDHMRQQFKSLVDGGQIEMVNGAWSMNDEACTNYQSTIDQFTWGLKVIDETIGKCGIPRVGWQIDPFGHSREQASLLSQMGYDAVFFARLDHDDKDRRQKDAALDFAWQGSANLDDSTIFGSIFPTPLYMPPEGYCWDYQCADDSIDDDPQSPDYNVKAKMEHFVDLVKNYSSYYPTKNIIIPMGGDFQYEAAEMNFINMDKFIKAFENHTEINVIYSTPSCYVNAVNKAKPKLTLKTDDFFPYSSDKNSFWSGYFTSRPTSKRFERIGHNVLQATKQLFALSSFPSHCVQKHLQHLREAMGVMQHHDAITGTEKEAVAKDYVRKLTRGIEFAEMHYSQIAEELLNSSSSLNISLSTCLLSNVSICTVSQSSDTFVVVVYNPLAWPVTHYIRTPVEVDGTFLIQGPEGEEDYDVVPAISSFDFVKLEAEKPAPFDLVFAAKDVPAMGMKLYHVSKVSAKRPTGNLETITSTAFETDSKNILKSVTLNGQTVNITQEFYYYQSGSNIQNLITFETSGAYIFRPTGNSPLLLGDNVTVLHRFYGKLVDEVHQRWNNDVIDIVQSIRWYKTEDYIEFDWIVGDIDVEKKIYGKEVISRFTITDDFDNKNVFYTDSNGREMIKRTKNNRPDYKYNASVEPVASNYYPVTSRIVMKDEEKNLEVAVLTDRSEGGSSMFKNQLELMLHRRLLEDDSKGVNEPLDETEFGKGLYVRGSHYLIIGKADGTNPNGKTTAASERILAQKKLVQPLVGFGSTSMSFEDIKNKVSTISYSALEKQLPENINILTFEPWNNDTYLLRLEHILEKNEDPSLSASETVSLQDIFKDFQLIDIKETTLAANMLVEDYKGRAKYSWQIENSTLSRDREVSKASSLDSISLQPMEIRSFIVKKGKKPVNFGTLNKPVVFLVLVSSILSVMFHSN